MKNNSFTKYSSTGRIQVVWTEEEILRSSRTELPNALPFILHISAIYSCVHRDTEEVPDTSFSGSRNLQRLRTACTYWNWNNNTSSRYRGLYPGICSPPRPDVLPRTGEVRSRPFHRGKRKQSTELHIYSIWRGSANVHR